MPCKLCERDLPLKNSHFLPKSVYKRYSELAATGTSLMMTQKFKSFKIGSQITQYLLCAECEENFNANGEDYFAKLAMPKLNDKLPPFIYRSLYSSIIPIWNKMGASILSFESRFFPKIKSDHIFHFAISMFWRGGLDGWRGYQRVIYDEGLMEAMRSYLLGQGCLLGYVVQVVPSFWKEKFSAVLPLNNQGTPFFSIYMYDFYLVRIPDEIRGYAARSPTPIIYTADSLKSLSSHLSMTTVINKSQRSRNLPDAGNLISWGLDSDKKQY